MNPSAARARRRPYQPRHRPLLEALEDRAVPAAPPLTDLTEGTASSWGTFASDGATAVVSDDTTHVRVGSRSLKLTTASGFDTGIRYTLPAGDSWDLTALDNLTFWTFGDNNTPIGFQGNQPVVVLSGPGGSFRYEPRTQQMPNHAWARHDVPLVGDADWVRTTT